MSSQFLKSIQAEPPVHRWLHSRDPDRDFSKDILESSATYITSIPSSQLTCAPVLPTVSLFVPMYRRNQVILGHLYGHMSPNSMAMTLLASKGQISPSTSISRRFAVDLSHDTINFIEYEWFTDGKLCVSIHHVDFNGMYNGQSILLDDPRHVAGEIPSKHWTKDDLLLNSTSPSKILMKLSFSQSTTCSKCYPTKSKCVCKHSSSSSITKSKSLYDPPTNWETWLSAFHKTRNGLANIHLELEIFKPNGIVHSNTTILVDQSCEIGIGQDSPTGSMLAKQFLSSMERTRFYPNIDSVFHSMIQGKQLVDMSNQLILDDNDEWNQQDCTSQSIKNPRVPPIPIINGFADTVAQGTEDIYSLTSLPQQEDKRNGGNKSSQKVVIEREQEKDVKSNLQKQKQPRRKVKPKKKLSLVCDICQHVFDHRGHYNEHRLGKHQGYKPHKCEFPGCQRYVLLLEMIDLFFFVSLQK